MRYLLPRPLLSLSVAIQLSLSVPQAHADHFNVEAATPGDIRVGSWNIANLHAVAGEVPEGREFAKPRSDTDYEWLAKTAKEIGFDVVALQEIHSMEAARRVFPESEYTLCFEEGRKAVEQKLDVNLRDAIYTAVVVRTSSFSSVDCFEVGELSVTHTDPDGVTRHVRGGTGATVARGNMTLTMLSVHLKSSCSNDTIDPAASAHCATFGRQIPILNKWIDTAYAINPNVIVAGDFNRNMYRDGEQFWPALDDGQPPSLDLFRIPFEEDGDDPHPCPRRRYQLDYLVFPKEVFEGTSGKPDYREGSFRRVTINGGEEADSYSDHCPVWGDFTWEK